MLLAGLYPAYVNHWLLSSYVMQQLFLRPSRAQPYIIQNIDLLPDYFHPIPSLFAIMSFEVTATIASFGGKLLKLTHQSSSTSCKMALNLYLPPTQSKKVPMLFYLAGLTCTGDNGAEKGFFQNSASKHGIAIVFPDTSPRELKQLLWAISS